MAVHFDGKPVKYAGCVFDIMSHAFLDGMVEERAAVWDMENHCVKYVTFGYYGSDGYNLSGGSAEVDIGPEAARDMIRTKKAQWVAAFPTMIDSKRKAVAPGCRAVVVRGRKVKPGTVLDVFWVGDRETYRSRQYSWMHETERIAGAHDVDGNKVWVKAEYLEGMNDVQMSAKERKEAQKREVLARVPRNVRKAAMS